MNEQNEQFMSEVEVRKEQLISHRRYLHQHPEVGFDMEQTTAYIRQFLEEKNIEIVPSKVGIIGIIRAGAGKGNGKIVGLRADMDALSLTEVNQVSYCSQNAGKMHACGHDGHAAMLMTAVDVLKQHETELTRDVVFFFQPAEEGPLPGGAVLMLEDLEKAGLASKVEFFGGLHLFTQCPVGTILLRDGSVMASTDEFYVDIIGTGGHAGSPHATVDAISIGAKFISEMESFMSRRINPFDPAVFSIGMFQGGSAINIVSETARIGATVRCLSEENRKFVLDSAEKIIKGICEYSGATCNVKIISGLPPLINNSQLLLKARTLAESVVGKENVMDKPHGEMGAEDFAYIAKRFPSVFLFIGAGNKEKGFTKLLHNPAFDFDEDALVVGSKMLCKLVLEL